MKTPELVQLVRIWSTKRINKGRVATNIGLRLELRRLVVSKEYDTYWHITPKGEKLCNILLSVANGYIKID